MNNDRPGFWHQLGVRDQNRLTTAGRIGHYPARAAICRQGDPATHLFVLISGLVKVVAVDRDASRPCSPCAAAATWSVSWRAS
ncbi:MAG TPA: cyclic nucleotide-binding domain-containing protein [Streptosporangiaceae bacterium]|nr:cyclic nucleotide-binding domain-containing protein [Streptosporangiaceae bacterium]